MNTIKRLAGTALSYLLVAGFLLFMLLFVWFVIYNGGDTGQTTFTQP